MIELIQILLPVYTRRITFVFDICCSISNSTFLTIILNIQLLPLNRLGMWAEMITVYILNGLFSVLNCDLINTVKIKWTYHLKHGVHDKHDGETKPNWKLKMIFIEKESRLNQNQQCQSWQIGIGQMVQEHALKIYLEEIF